jgi:hypothetical protein
MTRRRQWLLMVIGALIVLGAVLAPIVIDITVR